MRVNVTLPFDRVEHPEEFVTLEAVVEIATLLERLGYSGGNVTDHPVPSSRWLDAGGHYAQDPFVMLSLIAAHTTKLNLQTGILVLPYRNPFVVARSVSSLDAFSKGRVILGVGAGYLKAEYHALGVDFERRNDLMDEYIRALKAAWTGEDFTFEGVGYKALGNRMRPAPVQKPHPPILVGGNSKRAIRRAAELGDAWYPFFTPAGPLSKTSRTASMENDDDLAGAMAYLKEHCEKIGRASCDVVLGGLTHPGEKWTAPAMIDRIGRYKELGIKGCAVHLEGHTRREYCDNVERFAAEVLAKI
jgi:probable F420-dependent oxidoreductase